MRIAFKPIGIWFCTYIILHVCTSFCTVSTLYEPNDIVLNEYKGVKSKVKRFEAIPRQLNNLYLRKNSCQIRGKTL